MPLVARLHPNQLDSVELLVIITTVAIAHQAKITMDIKAKFRATDSKACSSNNNKTSMLLVSLEHRCAHHFNAHQFASLNLTVPLNAHHCVNQFAHLNSVLLNAHLNSVVLHAHLNSVLLHAHLNSVLLHAHLNSVLLHAHPNSVVPAVLLFKCLCQLKSVQALSAIITLAALALPR
jgi:hypothetical protein